VFAGYAAVAITALIVLRALVDVLGFISVGLPAGCGLDLAGESARSPGRLVRPAAVGQAPGWSAIGAGNGGPQHLITTRPGRPAQVHPVAGTAPAWPGAAAGMIRPAAGTPAARHPDM